MTITPGISPPAALRGPPFARRGRVVVRDGRVAMLRQTGRSRASRTSSRDLSSVSMAPQGSPPGCAQSRSFSSRALEGQRQEARESTSRGDSCRCLAYRGPIARIPGRRSSSRVSVANHVRRHVSRRGPDAKARQTDRLGRDGTRWGGPYAGRAKMFRLMRRSPRPSPPLSSSCGSCGRRGAASRWARGAGWSGPARVRRRTRAR